MVNSSGVLIRSEVHSPAGEDALQWYGRGVAAMKKRDPEDPTSWMYQANIHGTYTTPLKELWNQCEHQSWYFAPWHRMYVYFFEQIIRRAITEAGGPEDWALPYWNYGLGGSDAALPEPFRQPASESENPLYVADRNPYYNEGGQLPPAVASPAKALARPLYIGIAEFGGGSGPAREPRFWGQPGELERTPHNAVHSQIGGAMGDPELAAQDPIFWLHHCNIDRIWAIWNEHEHHEDPTEDEWLEHRFEFFDADGQKVSKACGEVRETIAQLGYTFDPSPAASTVEESMPAAPPPQPSGSSPSQPKFLGATEEKVPLTGEAVEVPVGIDPRGREEAFEAATPEGANRLYLNIEDIEGEQNPSTVYGVYLNLPQDPGPQDYERHHVGNLSFFGIEKAQAPIADKAPHGMRASFEVGPLVDSLRKEGDWDEEDLRVRFAPIVPERLEGVTAAPPGTESHEPIHIGRVSLSVDS